MKYLGLLSIGLLASTFAACSSDNKSSATPDGGVDAGPGSVDTTDAATCGKLPATGPTQVVQPNADGETETGARVAFTLDKQGRPFYAYIEFKTTGGGTLFVVSWDDCQGVWRAPLAVDDAVVETGTRSLSISVDQSDGRIGIAYVKHQLLVAKPNQNETEAGFLALSSDSGLTFTKTKVSHHDFEDGKGGEGDANEVTTARVALGGGKTYLAYVQNGRGCGTTTPVKCVEGAVMATQNGSAWTYETVKDGHSGDDFAPSAEAREFGLGFAADSTGKPAMVLAAATLTSYNTALLFWRPGTTAVKITDTAGNQNDDGEAALAFDGTKPRVLHRIGRGAIGAVTDYDISFSASDDGTTWTPQVPIVAPEHVTYSGNIAVANGKVFVFAGGPHVFTSTDLKTFTLDDFGLAQTSGSVTGAVDASGKYWVGFEGMSDGHYNGGGVVLYRQP